MSSGISLTCCLCSYQASTDLELENHIDLEHSDIFRAFASNQFEDQKNFETTERVRQLSNKSTETPQSGKRRISKKQETPVEMKPARCQC
jgi:hypothetical protein